MRTIDNIAVWDRLAGQVACTYPLYVLDELPAAYDARLLDYGCGEGRALRYLADRGFRRLVGWDPAPEMAAFAVAACPEAEVSSGRNDTVTRPSAFDVVSMTAVLSSVVTSSERAQILDRLHSTLTFGGLLALGDFGISSADRYLGRYETNGLGPATFETEDGVVIHHFKLVELVDLVAAAGFKLISHRTVSAYSLHGHPLPAHFLLAQRS
jgi:SAM-dependent methyltransferase